MIDHVTGFRLPQIYLRVLLRNWMDRRSCYEQLGHRMTGEYEDGEAMMSLDLTTIRN